MTLPRCKNPDCPAPSQTRLLLETASNWQFACTACHAMWVVSKPNFIKAARHEAYMNKLQVASQREKQALAIKKFGPPSSGWTAIGQS